MTKSRNYLDSTGISDEIYKLFPDTRLANTIIRTAVEWGVDEIGDCTYDVLSKIKITDRSIGARSIIRINEVLAKMDMVRNENEKPALHEQVRHKKTKVKLHIKAETDKEIFFNAVDLYFDHMPQVGDVIDLPSSLVSDNFKENVESNFGEWPFFVFVYERLFFAEDDGSVGLIEIHAQLRHEDN